MTTPAVDMSGVLWRVRGEYCEMPGVSLTLAHAQRLWGFDRSTCEPVLRQLVNEHFLRRSRAGTFVRACSRHTAALVPQALRYCLLTVSRASLRPRAPRERPSELSAPQRASLTSMRSTPTKTVHPPAQSHDLRRWTSSGSHHAPAVSVFNHRTTIRRPRSHTCGR